MFLIKVNFYSKIYTNFTTEKANIYSFRIEDLTNKHSQMNSISKTSGGKGRRKDITLATYKELYFQRANRGILSDVIRI